MNLIEYYYYWINVRAVTQKPLAFFLSLAPTLTSIMDDEDAPTSKDGDVTENNLEPEARRYIQLFKLVTHLAQADAEFQLRNLVLMTFFLYLLETSGYMQLQPDGRKNSSSSGYSIQM